MKIGKRKLRLSSGKVIKFHSTRRRANFERVAEAVKHNPSFKMKLARKGKR